MSQYPLEFARAAGSGVRACSALLNDFVCCLTKHRLPNYYYTTYTLIHYKLRTATGYPVMVRAAYALGGLGSGICDDEVQVTEPL
jgi:carbamoylphosphate synthase large subunit